MKKVQKLSDTFKLSNGYEIPCVGFGTWQITDEEVVVKSVTDAISAGYRHIDTAAAYENEESIGKAIKLSGVKREDLFVTSKVWNTERGYDKAMKAFEKTINRLGLDYLDLYLIHWPASSSQFDNWEELNLGTWKAMCELYKAGKIKAIGVSNFMEHHLSALMKTEVKPMVNQIEYHPGFMQEETVKFCKENNILVEAWSPLGSGRLLDNQMLKDMAEKYGKTAAQVCLRACLQNGVVPLPKSATSSRINQNADIFDFEISANDMEKINSMPLYGASGHHPDKVDF